MNRKDKILNIMSNRLVILFCFIMFFFTIIIRQLYNLQILHHEDAMNTLRETTTVILPLAGNRGNIYDKFGREIAINESAYNLKIDSNLSQEDANNISINIIKLLNKHNQDYVDDFPISESEPYEFLFDGNKQRELDWKVDIGIKEEDLNMSATETIKYLETFFELKDESLEKSLYEENELRDILSIRTMIQLQRYRKYKSITIAYNINKNILIEVEENKQKYKGAFIEIEPIRVYPDGKYLSNLVGYTGNLVTPDEIDTFITNNEDKNSTYDVGDVIGKTGLEYALEKNLAGKDGEEQIETNNLGVKVQVLDTKNAISGDDVKLTIDKKSQVEIYNMIEQVLSETIRSKIIGNEITLSEFFVSLVETNNVNSKKIINSTEEQTYSYSIKQTIENNIGKDDNTKEYQKTFKTELINLIENDLINLKYLLLTMFEQGTIKNEEYYNKLINNNMSVYQSILMFMEEGLITPSMTNLEPSSASVVALNNVGEVVVAVSYPSFDNNKLVNNFDYEYYEQLSTDKSNPLINRPFKEARAPGSTFKMITALAGLEEGIITPQTYIYDDVIFTKAGKPYISSWANYSFGSIDVEEALERSSNYFFNEVAYRMGNSKEDTTLQAIEMLNKYMNYMGLNERAGVEIGEHRDTIPSDTPAISSPEYRKYLALSSNPEADESTYKWTDGNTLQTSIGQGDNNYTSLSMAKYISVLANKGKKYKTYMIDSKNSYKNNTIENTEPVLEDEIIFEEQNLNAIYTGVEKVIKSKNGTAQSIFAESTLDVIGKTGTAQENKNRNDHSSFGGFMPKDDPQTIIYTMVPYGYTKVRPAIASEISREALEILTNENYIDNKKNKKDALIK